ncbi:MarR family winged helix-turn-helix transcriptional regulator [Archangium sp.]|uniref:MarR family winged helix-turn-helix transcriptional regulator n=1 Tax=Archangium sp. TaxID=1872627 RepID=UPI002D752144|nr:MarR family transcriptional regulator [Archangium sp.]HYO51894.1 MarR family transcriptional regulator [Archangium sp.]
MTLPEQVGSLRRTLYRLLTRRLSGRTRRPLTQLLALKFIAARGVRTQAELAERLLVDAPAVSRLVDRLEEDGLVKRCTGEDRRSVRLQVTEASRAELAVLEEEAQWLDDEAGRHLTPSELSELKRLLDKLQVGLMPQGPCATSEGESPD